MRTPTGKKRDYLHLIPKIGWQNRFTA